MAFDGITVANIAKELNDCLKGGRIYKIAQPESDELLITIKNNGSQYRLLLSADASLPLIYLTDKNKPSPMTAPVFCMLLRKHLQNARILEITQPGLERIIRIHMEHLNEMGDLCTKTLVIEIMGKHSNIIFCNEEDVIIDSIKHISGMVSSVREVLPGRKYFIPQTQNKSNPLELVKEAKLSGLNPDLIHNKQDFMDKLPSIPQPSYKALYTTFTGLSPIIAQEICYRAGVDGDMPANVLDETALEYIYVNLSSMMNEIKDGSFEPNIVYDNNTPIEFAATRLSIYSDKNNICFSTISEVLEHYYEEKKTP